MYWLHFSSACIATLSIFRAVLDSLISTSLSVLLSLSASARNLKCAKPSWQLQKSILWRLMFLPMPMVSCVDAFLRKRQLCNVRVTMLQCCNWTEQESASTVELFKEMDSKMRTLSLLTRSGSKELTRVEGISKMCTCIHVYKVMTVLCVRSKFC